MDTEVSHMLKWICLKFHIRASFYIVNKFEWHSVKIPLRNRVSGIDLSEFKQSWDYKDTDSQKEHNFNQMDKNADGVLTDYDLALIFLTADTNQGMLWCCCC